MMSKNDTDVKFGLAEVIKLGRSIVLGEDFPVDGWSQTALDQQCLEEDWKNFEEELNESLKILQGEDLLDWLLPEAIEDYEEREEKYEEATELLLEAVNTLNALVFVQQGALALKEKGFISDFWYEIIDQKLENIYDWFFHNFEPYRLVFFNPVRKRLLSYISEEFRPLFPWISFLVEEDPDELFNMIEKQIFQNSKITFPKFIENDLLLMKIFKYWEELSRYFYKNIAKYSDILLIFDRIDSKLYEYYLPKEVAKLDKSQYLYLSQKILKDLKKEDKSLAQRVAICCCPMSLEKRLMFFLEYLKFGNRYKDFEFLDLIFRMWKEMTLKKLPEVLYKSVSEEDAQQSLERFLKSLFKPPSLNSWFYELYDSIFKEADIRRPVPKFAYARMKKEGEGYEILLRFEISIPKEEEIEFFDLEKVEILKGNEEEFEKIREMRELCWFVWKDTGEIGSIMEAENVDEITMEREKLENISELLLFIWPKEEKEILEQLRRYLQKQEQEKAGELISQKVIIIKVHLKAKDKK